MVSAADEPSGQPVAAYSARRGRCHGDRLGFCEFETSGGHYTWWSPMGNARAKNVGWRLDYFLVSSALLPRLKKAFIRDKVLGADHCPVGIEI
jgi:hypothetical protein